MPPFYDIVPRQRRFGLQLCRSQWPQRCEADIASRHQSPNHCQSWSPEAMAMAAQAKVLSGNKLEQLVVLLQRHSGRPKEACWRSVIKGLSRPPALGTAALIIALRFGIFDSCHSCREDSDSSMEVTATMCFRYAPAACRVGGLTKEPPAQQGATRYPGPLTSHGSTVYQLIHQDHCSR
jgi:hypothetical protein